MAPTMRKLIGFANLVLATTSLLLSMPSVTNGGLFNGNGNDNGIGNSANANHRSSSAMASFNLLRNAQGQYGGTNAFGQAMHRHFSSVPNSLQMIADRTNIAKIQQAIAKIVKGYGGNIRRASAIFADQPFEENAVDAEQEKKLVALKRQLYELEGRIREEEKKYELNHWWAEANLRQYKGKDRTKFVQEQQNWHQAHLGRKRCRHCLDKYSREKSGLVEDMDTNFSPELQEKVQQKQEKRENQMLEGNLQRSVWGFK